MNQSTILIFYDFVVVVYLFLRFFGVVNILVHVLLQFLVFLVVVTLRAKVIVL
jgi:hypothetical protein